MRIIRYTKEYVFDLCSPPTPQCHASTVLKLENGDLLAAWFGGTKEGDTDVRIWVSRRHNGRWGKPFVIEDGLAWTHWNPVLFRNRKGEIFLFYKSGSDRIETWKTYVVRSVDGGRSFSAARELVPGDVGGRGPVKNKPIYLSDGTLLAPASIERPDIWYCMIDISHDDGYTWEAVRIPMPLEPDADPRTTLIQPTLWEAPAGCVHALMRTNRGCAYRSDSTDGGRSWCAAYPTEIPNNGSGLDLTQLRDGTLALVSNPVARHRYPLTLGFSDNGGQSFRRVLTLEDDVGEFSYPAVIADGNTLYITYTYDRRGIAFFEVTLAGDEPAGARPGSTPAGA